MTTNEKECREAVSDEELAACFAGTNFGSSNPREIVADTLLKTAGRYHTGHTALLCCQQLGLIGKNKHEPKLTLKGARYHYHAQKAAHADTMRLVKALQEVEEMLMNVQPHIPQALESGKSDFIDNYVNAALEHIKSTLTHTEGK